MHHNSHAAQHSPWQYLHHTPSCVIPCPQVTSTLELFDSLLSLHSEVTSRSSALSGACESLVREKGSLEEFADALRARLHFFDEYEAVYAQFHAAQVGVGWVVGMGVWWVYVVALLLVRHSCGEGAA